MVSKLRKDKVCEATNVTRVNNNVDAALRQVEHEHYFLSISTLELT